MHKELEMRLHYLVKSKKMEKRNNVMKETINLSYELSGQATQESEQSKIQNLNQKAWQDNMNSQYMASMTQMSYWNAWNMKMNYNYPMNMMMNPFYMQNMVLNGNQLNQNANN